MALKAIKTISTERHIPISTLRAAAERGPQAAGLSATKPGHDWLVDDESENFLTWLESRPKPGRGRKPSQLLPVAQKSGTHVPHQRETIQAATAAAAKKEPIKHMWKLAVGLQKGGVGKTSTTLCLGAGLVMAGKRVLLVDMDAQGNLTTASGVDKFEVTPLYTPLNDMSIRLKDVVISTDYGYDLLPNNGLMDKLPMQLAAEMGRERRLAKKLRELEADGYEYDYVLFDLPPTRGLAANMALTACDAVIIPVQCHEFAFEGLGDFNDTLELVIEETNPSLKILRVILTMYRTQTTTSRKIAEEVRQLYGDLVSPTVIKYSEAMTKLATSGPIQAYAPRHEVALAYNNLAQEVIDATITIAPR